MREPVTLNGSDLTVPDVVSIARDGLSIDLDVDALARVAATSGLARALGNSDGVEFDLTESAMELSRAGIVVRVNQLLADGSGAKTESILSLAKLLLADELISTDAMVADAMTVGRVALVAQELDHFIDRSLVVTALSWLVLDGDTSCLGSAVHNARPHPGAVSVARTLRELLASASASSSPTVSRSCLSATATVAGTLWEKIWDVHGVLAVEMNSSSSDSLVLENETMTPQEWDQSPLIVVLDAVRLAMARYLLLSIRRCQALECAGAATDRIIADIWRAAEPVSLRADQSSSGAAARLAALRSEAMLEQAWSLLAIEVSVASVALKGRSVGPALHLWIDALAPLVDRFETEAVLRR